jgi:hypothetical protein
LSHLSLIKTTKTDAKDKDVKVNKHNIHMCNPENHHVMVSTPDMYAGYLLIKTYIILLCSFLCSQASPGIFLAL